MNNKAVPESSTDTIITRAAAADEMKAAMTIADKLIEPMTSNNI
ncbi:hypothetical protein NST84_17290 [Paenibacillus sp. FSL R7-0345]